MKHPLKNITAIVLIAIAVGLYFFEETVKPILCSNKLIFAGILVLSALLLWSK